MSVPRSILVQVRLYVPSKGGYALKAASQEPLFWAGDFNSNSRKHVIILLKYLFERSNLLELSFIGYITVFSLRTAYFRDTPSGSWLLENEEINASAVPASTWAWERC